MALIGYARISLNENKQVFDRQIDALIEVGCERIFKDTISGTNFERKYLTECLNYLRKGDVLVVLDLDRLGRLAKDLINLIDELEHRGIKFKALNSPMDTTSPMGRAFLQIQAAFSEMEKNIIRQRVREGLKASRARGRLGGRPRIMTVEKLKYAQHLMRDNERSIPSIRKELNDLPASTLYHYLYADGKLKKAGENLILQGLSTNQKNSLVKLV